MTASVRGVVAAALVAAWSAGSPSAGPLSAGPLSAQPPVESREVRQLVTFRFLPGQTNAALEIYRTHLSPIYREIEAMRTVRAFGEVESPESLDLVVVTHYADLAAMDRANRDLRRPWSDHPPVFELYRQVSDLSLGHTDQFVELISPPPIAAVPDGMLEVLEFLRLTPGSSGTFERQVLAAVHPWEQQTEMRDVIVRSETARFLVADGWDYLRTYAVRDLGAWQAYNAARARHPVTFQLQRSIAARKTIILREIPELRVR